MDNVVLKRLSACSDKPTSLSIPARRPTRSKHRNNNDWHLAAAITSKWEASNFVPQSACYVRRIRGLQTTLKHSKPFEQNIIQLLKIVHKRMTSLATFDFSHFKSHRKTLLNALGFSLQAHLTDGMASLHSIFETF